jgi:NADH-quinone oxidoreductase subunit E
MPISDVTREEASRLVRRYPVARSALLPLLHLVQSEEGYVSEDGIGLCADVLGLTRAEVGAVATFYTMYKREPVGDYLLSVCTNPTCKIAGGQAIYDAYVDACGGHVDREAGVMVEHAECLGICDAAPVVQVNYEMYGPVTHDEAMDLLAKARAADPPASNRSGQIPPTFRAVEREFSGIDDGVDAHLIEAARLQALASVPPAYRSGETDIPVTHPGGDPAGHGGAAFRTAFASHTEDERPGTVAPAEQEEIVEELAESGAGVAQELAQQVTGDQPVGEPAPADEQPAVAGLATSAEAEGRPATGTEQEPSDSIAGEGGEEDLEQPVGDRDVPSEEASEPATHTAAADDPDPDPGGAPDPDTASDDDAEEG